MVQGNYIKVEARQNTITLEFEKQISHHRVNPVILRSQCYSMANDRYGCVSDLSYTIKRIENHLLVFSDNECTVDMEMNTKQFFKALVLIPEGIYKMDVESFRKIKSPNVAVQKTWVEIAEWIRFKDTDRTYPLDIKDSAIMAIKNARRLLDKDALRTLKRALGQKVGNAIIYADSFKPDEINFSWTGRYEGGCGINGGIIYSEYSNQYSSHS